MNIDRRTLLIGGGVGVGLVVGFALWPRGLPSGLVTGPHEQAFGNYIKVARDGRITVAVPQVETGQGIWTALPQIVADELGAAWDSIGVEPAPLSGDYANALAKDEGWPDHARITAGSTSVRAFEQPLREAAAIARMMLVGAAADRWNITPEECDIADGFVINRGRTFTFGELAEEAGDRTPAAQAAAPHFREGAVDRPAAAATRRSRKVRRKPALRRRRAAPGHAVCVGPRGATGREADEAFRARPSRVHRVFGASSRAMGGSRSSRDSWWAAERALKAADPLFSGEKTPTDMRALFEDALKGATQRMVQPGQIMNRRCVDRVRSPRLIMLRLRSTSGSNH